MAKRRWYDYLWIASALYLILGFFHILFAWLGLICFSVPLLISIFGGGKLYCNRYCGRGQLLELLGGRFKLSRKRDIPAFLRSAWLRYGFLAFFMTMFIFMLYSSYLVFAGAPLGPNPAPSLLWIFRLPWPQTDVSFVSPWIARFAFGFYGIMLSSNILGLLTMALFKPRSWCVYCPMGTMTQGICRLKNSEKTTP
jgi:polyferredoxin